MQKLFSSSLFGYSKKSVHSYISSMNDEFSQKMLAKEEEYKAALGAVQAELEQLRQENGRLLAREMAAAGALIDAKQLASDLINQAEAEGRALRDKNNARYQAERHRPLSYGAHIDSLRDHLCATFQALGEEMENYSVACQALREEGGEEWELSGDMASEEETPA